MIELNEGYREILDSIASDSPTPGGGSVAALSLAHAHALVCMVARLTLKSEKWKSGHESAQNALNSSNEGISYAIDLAHRDAQSFDSVISAFRMPNSTESEISDRREAILQGYIRATDVPMETARSGCELLGITLSELATNCNANAITDLGAAAELARSALSIAALNVRINIDSVELSTITPETDLLLASMNSMIDDIESRGAQLAGEISEIVSRRM